jgi:hypothetical protein
VLPRMVGVRKGQAPTRASQDPEKRCLRVDGRKILDPAELTDSFGRVGSAE